MEYDDDDDRKRNLQVAVIHVIFEIWAEKSNISMGQVSGFAKFQNNYSSFKLIVL